MKRQSLTTAFAASLLLWTGCAEPETTAPVDATTDTEIVDGRSTVIPYGRPDDFATVPRHNKQPVKNHHADHARARAAINEAVEDAGSHASVDRNVRDLLDQHRQYATHGYLEQYAAHAILTQIFESDDADPQLISKYTRMLLRNNSPNAPLILDAVKRLQGTWTNEERQSAARATADRALVWAAKVCTHCSAKTPGRTNASAPDPAILRAQDDVVRAANVLMQIAGP